MSSNNLNDYIWRVWWFGYGVGFGPALYAEAHESVPLAMFYGWCLAGVATALAHVLLSWSAKYKRKTRPVGGEG